MKIELQEPYASKWKSGYVVINPEGRQTLILYNSNKDRSSTAYARYLLAVKLGRFLTTEEEADHKDNDKFNDDPDNIQALDKNTHRKKSARGVSMIELVCSQCGITFSRERRRARLWEDNHYCTRQCLYDKQRM